MSRMDMEPQILRADPEAFECINSYDRLDDSVKSTRLNIDRVSVHMSTAIQPGMPLKLFNSQKIICSSGSEKSDITVSHIYQQTDSQRDVLVSDLMHCISACIRGEIYLHCIFFSPQKHPHPFLSPSGGFSKIIQSFFKNSNVSQPMSIHYEKYSDGDTSLLTPSITHAGDFTNAFTAIQKFSFLADLFSSNSANTSSDSHFLSVRDNSSGGCLQVLILPADSPFEEIALSGNSRTAIENACANETAKKLLTKVFDSNNRATKWRFAMLCSPVVSQLYQTLYLVKLAHLLFALQNNHSSSDVHSLTRNHSSFMNRHLSPGPSRKTHLTGDTPSRVSHMLPQPRRASTPSHTQRLKSPSGACRVSSRSKSPSNTPAYDSSCYFSSSRVTASAGQTPSVHQRIKNLKNTLAQAERTILPPATPPPVLVKLTATELVAALRTAISLINEVTANRSEIASYLDETPLVSRDYLVRSSVLATPPILLEGEDEHDIAETNERQNEAIKTNCMESLVSPMVSPSALSPALDENSALSNSQSPFVELPNDEEMKITCIELQTSFAGRSNADLEEVEKEETFNKVGEVMMKLDEEGLYQDRHFEEVGEEKLVSKSDDDNEEELHVNMLLAEDMDVCMAVSSTANFINGMSMTASEPAAPLISNDVSFVQKILSAVISPMEQSEKEVPIQANLNNHAVTSSNDSSFFDAHSISGESVYYSTFSASNFLSPKKFDDDSFTDSICPVKKSELRQQTSPIPSDFSSLCLSPEKCKTASVFIESPPPKLESESQESVSSSLVVASFVERPLSSSCSLLNITRELIDVDLQTCLDKTLPTAHSDSSSTITHEVNEDNELSKPQHCEQLLKGDEIADEEDVFQTAEKVIAQIMSSHSSLFLQPPISIVSHEDDISKLIRSNSGDLKVFLAPPLENSVSQVDGFICNNQSKEEHSSQTNVEKRVVLRRASYSSLLPSSSSDACTIPVVSLNRRRSSIDSGEAGRMACDEKNSDTREKLEKLQLDLRRQIDISSGVEHSHSKTYFNSALTSSDQTMTSNEQQIAVNCNLYQDNNFNLKLGELSKIQSAVQKDHQLHSVINKTTAPIRKKHHHASSFADFLEPPSLIPVLSTVSERRKNHEAFRQKTSRCIQASHTTTDLAPSCVSKQDNLQKIVGLQLKEQFNSLELGSLKEIELTEEDIHELSQPDPFLNTSFNILMKGRNKDVCDVSSADNYVRDGGSVVEEEGFILTPAVESISTRSVLFKGSPNSKASRQSRLQQASNEIAVIKFQKMNNKLESIIDNDDASGMHTPVKDVLADSNPQALCFTPANSNLKIRIKRQHEECMISPHPASSIFSDTEDTDKAFSTIDDDLQNLMLTPTGGDSHSNLDGIQNSGGPNQFHLEADEGCYQADPQVKENFLNMSRLVSPSRTFEHSPEMSPPLPEGGVYIPSSSNSASPITSSKSCSPVRKSCTVLPSLLLIEVPVSANHLEIQENNNYKLKLNDVLNDVLKRLHCPYTNPYSFLDNEKAPPNQPDIPLQLECEAHDTQEATLKEGPLDDEDILDGKAERTSETQDVVNENNEDLITYATNIELLDMHDLKKDDNSIPEHPTSCLKVTEVFITDNMKELGEELIYQSPKPEIDNKSDKNAEMSELTIQSINSELFPIVGSQTNKTSISPPPAQTANLNGLAFSFPEDDGDFIQPPLDGETPVIPDFTPTASNKSVRKSSFTNNNTSPCLTSSRVRRNSFSSFSRNSSSKHQE